MGAAAFPWWWCAAAAWRQNLTLGFDQTVHCLWNTIQEAFRIFMLKLSCGYPVRTQLWAWISLLTSPLGLTSFCCASLLWTVLYREVTPWWVTATRFKPSQFHSDYPSAAGSREIAALTARGEKKPHENPKGQHFFPWQWKEHLGEWSFSIYHML